MNIMKKNFLKSFYSFSPKTSSELKLDNIKVLLVIECLWLTKSDCIAKWSVISCDPPKVTCAFLLQENTYKLSKFYTS